jgi:ElaA protein
LQCRRALVARGLDAVAEHYAKAPVRISAQAYLERFYGEFGFARVGANYLEDHIPHCAMRRPGG